MADHWNSLPGMLLDVATRRSDRPMLRHWAAGGWQQTTWRDFTRAVAAAAAGLRAQGIAAGDRVLLVSENRPEFPIAETALMSLGAVVVPTYVTNTVRDDAHILRDSGARAAIVSSAALAARVREAAGPGGLDLLVSMEPEPAALAWQALLADPGDPARLAADVAAIRADDLACLIYTSGTGGPPKGVMLPHRSMLANQHAVAEAVAPMHLDGERYLSFLPLSHSYEHTVGNYLLPSLGMEVVYSRGADRLAAEFREIEPALVTAVPRLFEVLRGRITAEVARQPAWKRILFARTLRLGLRRLDGPRLTPAQRVEDLALDRLVRRTVRGRFGSRLQGIVSGGARLDPGLSGFFLALGVPLLQGYGQTEAGPVVSVNLPWDNDRRSVGRPLPGVEARIAGTGELLLRGDLVMDGYWNDTAAVPAIRHDPDADPDDGLWLHTGDVARIENGRIVIEDRLRDFIKLVGGEMVSPAKLETLLIGEAGIAQAVVAGEGRPHVVALVVPEEDADPAAAIRRVNARLARPEQIRRWGVMPAATVENGLLTATMKLRRRLVLQRHAAAVDALYAPEAAAGRGRVPAAT